jgi:RNA ligase
MASSIFPIIRTLTDLKPVVEHHPEIRFTTLQNGFTVACVMISNSELYAGPDAAFVKECRGITFDPTGVIACRPLHKFFNVGERQETQVGNIDWAQVTRMMEKRDGSMINPVIVNGVVQFKSKKVFESDVAIIANAIATVNDRAFSHVCLEKGITPTFEFTTPRKRIVIKYPTEKLVLLHARENVSGRYLTRTELEALAIEWDIELVKEFNFESYDLIKQELETIENFEGYSIQFESGEMVKAKAKWYLDRHHMMTALTQRNVAEAVVEETLDDLKSYIAGLDEPELFSKITEIEKEIVEFLVNMSTEIDSIFEQHKQLDRKEFAITLRNHKFFWLLMEKYQGKEVSINQFYAKHFLKARWTSETI